METRPYDPRLPGCDSRGNATFTTLPLLTATFLWLPICLKTRRYDPFGTLTEHKGVLQPREELSQSCTKARLPKPSPSIMTKKHPSPTANEKNREIVGCCERFESSLKLVGQMPRAKNFFFQRKRFERHHLPPVAQVKDSQEGSSRELAATKDQPSLTLQLQKDLVDQRNEARPAKRQILALPAGLSPFVPLPSFLSQVFFDAGPPSVSSTTIRRRNT